MIVIIPFQFCRSGNGDSERGWDLPKVTQLACGAAESRTQDSRVAGVCRGSRKRLRAVLEVSTRDHLGIFQLRQTDSFITSGEKGFVEITHVHGCDIIKSKELVFIPGSWHSAPKTIGISRVLTVSFVG